MGQANRTIIVHAFDDEDSNGGVSFSMSGFDVHGGEIKCSKDDRQPKMHKKDHHKVVFELANRSSRSLRFPHDASAAIWVGADDQHCPSSPCSNPEIKPQNVSPDRESLTVFNLNSREARFKFSLVFEDAERGERYVYDPIWANKNGGMDA